MSAVRIKICGLTSVADAEMCVEAGADALGLNFYRGSPRACPEQTARAIVSAVGGRALIVGVFVDASADELERARASLGLGCLQLHGDEPPDLVQRFLPHAYKALRVQGGSSIDRAGDFPGEHVLLDAYVAGVPGGTGATFDWALAATLARQRKLTLAGGLTPSNVARAVRVVRPYCVDTASGVESAPGVKDAALVAAFVREARSVQ